MLARTVRLAASAIPIAAALPALAVVTVQGTE